MKCKYCGSEDIQKRGKTENGDHQRYKCNVCGKWFQEEELINEPIYLDKKNSEKIDWREWLKNFKQQQELHKKSSSSQDEATIKLPDKKTKIVFSADWHLGSISVDYEDFQKNIEAILQGENVYMVTVGDLIDNFRKFYSLQPVLSQIVNPKDQKLLLESILDEMIEKKKWLAACWGNHDIARDEKMYGESPIKELLGRNFVYFNGKGTLNLEIGKQKYQIVLSHSFTGYSMYNPNHSQNRQLKWYSPNADVICSAHKHSPAVQYFYAYGKRKCLIQVGTFLTDDGYSKRYWEKGVAEMPTIVFDNEKHDCYVRPNL